MTSAPVRVEDARVPLRDGVALAADVVRPDDRRRRPVLLVRTPYSRQGLREAHDPVGWARAGWAVVLQDVRGRFHSEGDFQPFHQEVADGADTVAWCAAQPWSDGTVAMTGGSYNGATQWLAALARPPALKAIAPLLSAAGIREWFAPGGAPEHAFPVAWALMMAASRPGVDKAEARRLLALARDWHGLLRLAPGDPTLSALHEDLRRWGDPGDREFWAPLDVPFGQLDLPAWHLTGWYDLFCEGALDTYVAMATGAATPQARRSQRLVVGPWSHTTLWQQATPEVDFGIDANGVVRGLPGEMLRFLRAGVAGREPRGGVTVFVMGANRWRHLPAWPPASTPGTWFLGAATGANGVAGDGRLLAGPPARGEDHLDHDPADPVPTRGGRILLPVLPMPGPMDQREVEGRPDVLVYTGDPLRRPLTVIGTVRARLTVAASAQRVDLAVKLCDVDPSGRSVDVVDAVVRRDVTAGRAKAVDVRVGSTAYRFAPGHRLRLTIAASNFPRYAPLPAARLTLRYGGARPPALTLPLAT